MRNLGAEFRGIDFLKIGITDNEENDIKSASLHCTRVGNIETLGLIIIHYDCGWDTF